MLNKNESTCCVDCNSRHCWGRFCPLQKRKDLLLEGFHLVIPSFEVRWLAAKNHNKTHTLFTLFVNLKPAPAKAVMEEAVSFSFGFIWGSPILQPYNEQWQRLSRKAFLRAEVHMIRKIQDQISRDFILYLWLFWDWIKTLRLAEIVLCKFPDPVGIPYKVFVTLDQCAPTKTEQDGFLLAVLPFSCTWHLLGLGF